MTSEIKRLHEIFLNAHDRMEEVIKWSGTTFIFQGNMKHLTLVMPDGSWCMILLRNHHCLRMMLLPTRRDCISGQSQVLRSL